MAVGEVSRTRGAGTASSICRGRVKVRTTATSAQGRGVGVEQAPCAGLAAGGQLRSRDTICPSFVVDQAAGSELGEGEEARPLKVGTFGVAVTATGDECRQRQTREVVSRQKRFRCQIAVGIKIARETVRTALQKIEPVSYTHLTLPTSDLV